MSNTNSQKKGKFLSNHTFIHFYCFSVRNPDKRLSGSFHINDFSAKKGNFLSKSKNDFHLKISVSNNNIVKLLSNPEIITYINITSSYTYPIYMNALGKNCVIDKLLHKEHYNLLIEMNPLLYLHNYKDQYRLFLDLTFDPDSDNVAKMLIK